MYLFVWFCWRKRIWKLIINKLDRSCTRIQSLRFWYYNSRCLTYSYRQTWYNDSPYWRHYDVLSIFGDIISRFNNRFEFFSFAFFSTYYKYSTKYYIPENCYWHPRKKNTSLFLSDEFLRCTPLVRNIISYVGLLSVFMMLTFTPPRPFHAYLLRFQNKALWLKYVEEDSAYKIRWRSPGHFQTRAKAVIYKKNRK